MGFLFSPSSLLLLGCSILKWSLRHLNGDPISVCSRIFLCLWQKQSHVLLYVFVSKIFFLISNYFQDEIIFWPASWSFECNISLLLLNFFTFLGQVWLALFDIRPVLATNFDLFWSIFEKKNFGSGWVESPKILPLSWAGPLKTKGPNFRSGFDLTQFYQLMLAHFS